MFSSYPTGEMIRLMKMLVMIIRGAGGVCCSYSKNDFFCPQKRSVVSN
jgi:hypothetical protein